MFVVEAATDSVAFDDLDTHDGNDSDGGFFFIKPSRQNGFWWRVGSWLAGIKM